MLPLTFGLGHSVLGQVQCGLTNRTDQGLPSKGAQGLLPSHQMSSLMGRVPTSVVWRGDPVIRLKEQGIGHEPQLPLLCGTGQAFLLSVW